MHGEGRGKMSERGSIYREIAEEEEEDISSESEECSDAPFDPRSVNVYSKSQVINLLVRRIKTGALDLHPDFQRSAGIWNKVKQSRLIESLLIKIPIPSLYFDASDDSHWLVIDGLQRLSTIDDFVNDRFRLTKLEFLHDLEGLTYSQLPAIYQMRIDETEVTSYLVMPGTPLRVKFDIFRRINTGGVPLSQQEIRHALNMGPCTDLLKEMTESDAFRNVVGGGISDVRMADRECALRYLVFSDLTPEAYKRNDFNMFLCEYMESFNALHKGQKMNDDQMSAILVGFEHAMTLAEELFGESAFRLLDANGHLVSKRVNKALFEAWSVNLSKLDDLSKDILRENKGNLVSAFAQSLAGNIEFYKSVAQATGSVSAVHTRFSVVKSIIDEVVYA